jgi:hypothetical protein
MSHDPKFEIEPNEINDRWTREWNAAVGNNPLKARYTLLELAADVRNRLIDRVGDVGPGDRVTARLMLEAVGIIREAAIEIEKLRVERDDARWRLCKVVGDNREMWGEDVAKEYGWDYLKDGDK